MNMRHQHLNDEQIAASVVENDPELTAHLQECAECSGKAERLQQSLAGFGSFVRENAERSNTFWWRQRAAGSTPAIHLTRWATAAAALIITFAASYSFIHDAVTPKTAQKQQQVAPARQISDEALLSEVQNDVQREYPDAFAPVQANAESEVAAQVKAPTQKKEHKRK